MSDARRWECTCPGRHKKVWKADPSCEIHGEVAPTFTYQNPVSDPSGYRIVDSLGSKRRKEFAQHQKGEN